MPGRAAPAALLPPDSFSGVLEVSPKWAQEGKDPELRLTRGSAGRKFREASQRRRETPGRLRQGTAAPARRLGRCLGQAQAVSLTPTVAPGAPLSRTSGGSSLEDLGIAGTCDGC